MIVYIAGPISTAGVFEENIALFNKAELELKRTHTVLNPAGLPKGLTARAVHRHNTCNGPCC